MFQRNTFMLLAASFALSTACGGVAPEPEAPASTNLPDPGADQEYQAELPQPGRGDARYLGLRIDPRVECNLDEAPKFPFDESKMLPQHRRHIVDLAACLEAPHLADTTVFVVGHADPRGSDDYNQDLGLRRAEFVKSLLVKQGVDEDRIMTRSKGEDVAKGHSEDYAYGYDRRVEIHVDDVDYGPGPDHDAEVEPVGGR